MWLDVPSNALIFDESYYVNAARVAWAASTRRRLNLFYAPLHLDPNFQHPESERSLILVSISAFGDNAFGWRFASAVAGMVSLIALYGIVRALGGRQWLAVTAVAIYSIETLTFVISRIAMLDMMALAFVLVGAWLGLRKHWLLAGVFVALGALVKLPGVYGLLALLAWQAVTLVPLVRPWRIGWRALMPTAQLVGAFVVVGLVGMGLLDLRFTHYTNPFDHLVAMLNYGFSLKSGRSFNPQMSTPWQWLFGDGQLDLFRSVNGQIEFRAAVNPVLLGSLAFIVPFGAWAAWRQRDPIAGFALVWAAAAFLPYVALATVANRIMYIYYFLPTIPALAMLAAVFLFRVPLPRPVIWTYLGAMVVGFVAYFPFRAVPG